MYSINREISIVFDEIVSKMIYRSNTQMNMNILDIERSNMYHTYCTIHNTAQPHKYKLTQIHKYKPVSLKLLMPYEVIFGLS